MTIKRPVHAAPVANRGHLFQQAAACIRLWMQQPLIPPQG